ncbi:hypothetical protein [Agrobacterium sp. B1(2019)]|uniref:hypothetical protein n=1 Tax=Agrobacterium sp. B1(2019) TaxID=2607032 RepID=UPI0011EC1E24|nr:hypothetical protein [Agrobacterium sp. B1(2019)]TZG34243.1 hypothetical protein AGR1_16135 [Agrobacterium sp. B1(2019)]
MRFIFAEQLLIKEFAQALSSTRSELQSLVMAQLDTIEFEISPGQAELKHLCATQKAIWISEIRSALARLVGSLLLNVIPACIAFLSVLLFRERIAGYAAFAASGIASCWMLSLFLKSYRELRISARRGFASTSPHVFRNHGRSVWFVGTRGLYVALNGFAQYKPQCEFISFPEIGSIDVSRFDTETLVTLWSTTHHLVRVMIFPGPPTDSIPGLARLLASFSMTSNRDQRCDCASDQCQSLAHHGTFS